MPEYVETVFPRRVYVKQENYGVSQVSIYDADTHEPFTAVMRLTIDHHNGSEIVLTCSKYQPFKPVRHLMPDDKDWLEPHIQGIVCHEQRYSIHDLQINAGV